MEPSEAVTVAPARQPAAVADQKKQALHMCEASINVTLERKDLSGHSPEASQELPSGKDHSEEEWEEEDVEESTIAGMHPCKEQRQLSVPNRQTSPFDIRFSQMRARTEFRDGRLVEEAVASIKAVPYSEQDGEARVWRLEAPFPPIEVLQYRCKLRDEDGRPRLDSETGGEMWDADDHLFTLDNRRLYCYQKAAAALWPDKVVIDVIELPPQSLTRMRQVRKFRTMDSGESVLLGARGDEEALARWSWREAVGLGASEKKRSDSGPGQCYVKMRRRPRGEPRNGRSGRKFASPGVNATGKEDAGSSLPKHLMSFLVLYLVLRLGRNTISARFGGDNVASEQTDFAYGIGVDTGMPPNSDGILEPEPPTTPVQFEVPVLEGISLQTHSGGHAFEQNASFTGSCAYASPFCDSLAAAKRLEARLSSSASQIPNAS